MVKSNWADSTWYLVAVAGVRVGGLDMAELVEAIRCSSSSQSIVRTCSRAASLGVELHIDSWEDDGFRSLDETPTPQDLVLSPTY